MVDIIIPDEPQAEPEEEEVPEAEPKTAVVEGEYLSVSLSFSLRLSYRLLLPAQWGTCLVASWLKTMICAHHLLALEDLASKAAPIHRHSSASEKTWLEDMVLRYGSDYGAMARDKKLNVWQKTEGEIKRMVRKAGGVDKLK